MTPLPPLPCPRCKELLTELGIRSGRATGCNRCSGVWLDDAAYAEVRAQSWTRVIEKGSRKPAAERDDSRPLICPNCRKNLQKTELAHVIVDFCPGHGTWFDPGEIEAVAYEIARREREGDRPDAEPPEVRSASRWLDNAQSMNASLQRSVDTLVLNEVARVAERRREQYDDD